MQTFILESSVLTGGKTGTTENTTTTTNTTTAETQQSATTTTGVANSLFGGSSLFSIVLLYAAIIGAMYYFTIRPAKKREQLLQSKQDEIKLGDDVVTTSGMHGKVVDIGTSTFNIEFGTNKGVIIPVNKKDVLPVGLSLDTKNKKAVETTETK